MKYFLISLFILGACSKQDSIKECGLVADAIVRSSAVQLSKEYECDLNATLGVFIKAEEKILSCKSGIQYAGINGTDLVCSIVPQLAGALVGMDLLQLQCKNLPDIEAALKKVMKCE